jgi:hypothetical protein
MSGLEEERREDMYQDCSLESELLAVVCGLKMVLVVSVVVVAVVAAAAAAAAALGRTHRFVGANTQDAQIADVQIADVQIADAQVADVQIADALEAKWVPDIGQQSWWLGMSGCKQ